MLGALQPGCHMFKCCAFCVFSFPSVVGGVWGGKEQWEAPISQQANPAEGTRPLQADYKRETMIRVFAPFKNIISFFLI